jgi:hypothetical protein
VKKGICVVFDNNMSILGFGLDELPGVKEIFYTSKSRFRQYKDPRLLRAVWSEFELRNGYIFFVTRDGLFEEASQIDKMEHGGRLQIIIMQDEKWKKFFFNTDFYDFCHAPLDKLKPAVIHLWPFLLKHYGLDNPKVEVL